MNTGYNYAIDILYIKETIPNDEPLLLNDLITIFDRLSKIQNSSTEDLTLPSEITSFNLFLNNMVGLRNYKLFKYIMLSIIEKKLNDVNDKNLIYSYIETETEKANLMNEIVEYLNIRSRNEIQTNYQLMLKFIRENSELNLLNEIRIFNSIDINNNTDINNVLIDYLNNINRYEQQPNVIDKSKNTNRKQKRVKTTSSKKKISVADLRKYSNPNPKFRKLDLQFRKKQPLKAGNNTRKKTRKTNL
jgi:hypothetical protein